MTERIDLNADSGGGVLHGPADYSITNGDETAFNCGDFDGSGAVEPNDAMEMLFFLTTGSSKAARDETADANNSGAIDIQDAIGIVRHIFFADQMPSDPEPSSCGVDPDDPGSDGNLGCDVYSSCDAISGDEN